MNVHVGLLPLMRFICQFPYFRLLKYYISLELSSLPSTRLNCLYSLLYNNICPCTYWATTYQLSPSLSFSPHLSPTSSISSVSLSVSLCLSLSLSLFLSVSLCLSLSVSLCVSLCVCVSLSLFLSLSLCLSLSLSPSLRLPLPLSLPLSLSLSLSLSLPLDRYIYSQICPRRVYSIETVIDEYLDLITIVPAGHTSTDYSHYRYVTSAQESVVIKCVNVCRT